MNWTQYLFDEFIQDCLETLDADKYFHFSQEFLLINMIEWKLLGLLQGKIYDTKVTEEFSTLKFNIWQLNKDDEKQQAKNLAFQCWYTDMIQFSLIRIGSLQA